MQGERPSVSKHASVMHYACMLIATGRLQADMNVDKKVCLSIPLSPEARLKAPAPANSVTVLSEPESSLGEWADNQFDREQVFDE